MVMALPLCSVTTIGTVTWALAAGALLFAVYGFHTVLRHFGAIECNDDGIFVSGPFSRSVSWMALADVQVRYFSTRRDGRKGWMQLVVKSSTQSIRVESTLTGFIDIVSAALNAANKKGIDLSPTTLGNAEVLGVKTGFFTLGNGSPCRIS